MSNHYNLPQLLRLVHDGHQQAYHGLVVEIFLGLIKNDRIPSLVRLIAVLCGWDAQPVGFVVWRIGESRSSGRCETLSFSKRR